MWRRSGVGGTREDTQEGLDADAKARKLSNIEIKFISRHHKQLPLVLRVREIGNILKFQTGNIRVPV